MTIREPYTSRPKRSFSSGVAPKKRRTRRGAIVGLIAAIMVVPLLMTIGIFGFSYVVDSERTVDPSPLIAAGERNGAAVVAVPYERHGARGLLQRMQPMYQSRLALVNLHTGNHMWDVHLGDNYQGNMRALAVSDRYVYVATPDGLFIRSTADGSPVAGPSEIDGLVNYVEDTDAYEYDPGNLSIVMIDAHGAIYDILAGGTEAHRSQLGIVNTWQEPMRSPHEHDLSMDSLVQRAQLTDDTAVRVVPSGAGSQFDSLVVVSDDDEDTPLSDEEFVSARLVASGVRSFIEPTQDTGRSPDTRTWAAAGPHHAYILVEHETSVRDNSKQLSTVSIRTGEIRDTVDIVGSPTSAVRADDQLAVVTGYSGGTVMNLVTVDSRGHMTVSSFGKSNVLGQPW